MDSKKYNCVTPNKKCEKCSEKFLNKTECQCKSCLLNDICEHALDKNCAINLLCTKYRKR